MQRRSVPTASVRSGRSCASSGQPQTVCPSGRFFCGARFMPATGRSEEGWRPTARAGLRSGRCSGVSAGALVARMEDRGDGRPGVSFRTGFRGAGSWKAGVCRGRDCGSVGIRQNRRFRRICRTASQCAPHRCFRTCMMGNAPFPAGRFRGKGHSERCGRGANSASFL